MHIIDENIFDQAQFILNQRSSKNEEKQQIAKQQKAVHCCQEIYTVPTAVRRWYQQAILTDTTGQTADSTEFADRGIYVPIKR